MENGMYMLCKKLFRARSEADSDDAWNALKGHAGEEGKTVVDNIEKRKLVTLLCVKT